MSPSSTVGEVLRWARANPFGRLSATALAAAASVTVSFPAASRSEAASTSVPFEVIEVRGQGRPLARRFVDLDGDSKLDLLVVAAWSANAAAGGEDRVEDLIAYLTVTPWFLDTRRILLYRQTDAGFAPWGEPLALPGDAAVVDVADLDGDGRKEILFAAGSRLYLFRQREGGGGFDREPEALGDADLLVGATRSFVPGLRLTADLAKDGSPTFLFSTSAGLELRRLDTQGKLRTKADLVLRSGLRTIKIDENQARINDPSPRVIDGDADGTVDLLFERSEDLALYRGDGRGGVDAVPVRARLPSAARGEGRRQRRIEDIDGDELLDIVLTLAEGAGDQEGPREGAEGEERDGGGRARSKDRPLATVAIYRGLKGLRFPEAPDRKVEIARSKKYQGGWPILQKIDAGGQLDLVVLQFSTSIWQVARVVTTKKISVDVSYEARLQTPDGSFAPPAGRPFESKVTLDLKRGISGLPTAPRGDFNGDGVTDLVDFSDEPDARVHLTGADGVFAAKPAWTVPLPRAPQDRLLMETEDINGDGRSDLAFFNLEGSGFVGTILRSRR